MQRLRQACQSNKLGLAGNAYRKLKNTLLKKYGWSLYAIQSNDPSMSLNIYHVKPIG
jgi:hypothetical protein